MAGAGPRRVAGLRAVAGVRRGVVREDTVEVPVQINGKVRGKIIVPADADKATSEAAARADDADRRIAGRQEVVKAIVVPGRLVNFVTIVRSVTK